MSAGLTPLHQAVLEGNLQATLFLFVCCNLAFFCVLCCCCCNLAVTWLLMSSGLTPLHQAVLEGNLQAVKLLLMHEADVNRTDTDTWTPLHAACAEGHSEIVRWVKVKVNCRLGLGRGVVVLKVGQVSLSSKVTLKLSGRSRSRSTVA